MRGFLGWDVGAWHCQSGGSRDALVLLAERDGAPALVGRPWRGNLRATYNGATGAALLARLLALVGNAPEVWTELTLAIDTPLGWPESFHELLAGRAPPDVPEGKAQNPLLMRETERWLARRGHRPLSNVQDLIGSQSTKGLCFLAALGLAPRNPGVWAAQLGPTHLVAVEAYPATCAKSALITTTAMPLRSQLGGAHMDIQDALTCALVGWAFATRPATLAPPEPAVSPREGWIWVPTDCLSPGEPTP